MSKLVPAPATAERRLRLLARLARRINEHPDLDELMRFLYAQLRELLCVDAFVASASLPSGSAPQPILSIVEEREQPPDERRSGEPASSDTVSGPAAATVMARMPRSQIVCPVRAGSDVVGHIAVAAYQADAYDADDQQLLETIATQLAGCFERHVTERPAGTRPMAPSPTAPLSGDLAPIAAVLGAISGAIAAENNPDHLYALLLREAASIIPHDQAIVTILEEGVSRVAAASGAMLAPILAAQEHQQLWRAYRTLHLAAERELQALFARSSLVDLLSIPLTVNGAVAGRLTFATTQPPAFSVYHQQVGALLAERATQIARMAQLQIAHEAARLKIAQLDSLRHDFVATVSHELRTPLTGILGYMELLLNRWTSLDDERRRNMLQRAQSSAVRLEHLVTDLLLFSNVEHQELQLHIAAYPLAMLVEQAVEDMRTKYRGQQITVHPSTRPTMVRADAQRVIQVLANLLDNAIKYSAEGTPVTVRWVCRGAELHVAVRDQGPGIKQEDRARLFTRFGTLGHQPRPGQVGTGIGLYICKKLLDAMGGRIWLASTPGIGSIFHFTLPNAMADDLPGR